MQLEIVELKGRGRFYRDERLGEYRHVDNPHVRVKLDRVCGDCGSVTEDCSFCDQPAFKWLEADVLVQPGAAGLDAVREKACVYFCDLHQAVMWSEQMQKSGPNVPEWGAYAPGEPGCGCDPWT